MNNELNLHERVSVISIFDSSQSPCRPIKFKRLSGREVVISKIGLGYPVRRGTRTAHIFDVSDGQADYRLEFDALTLSWWLTREADYEN